MASALRRRALVRLVQDFADACQAVHVSRDVDLIVPAAIYREWIAIGDVPERLPRGVDAGCSCGTR
jgi:hypothetical protein